MGPQRPMGHHRRPRFDSLVLDPLGDQQGRKINEYIDHYIKLVRTEPYKLQNIKELWSTAGWQIALDMRRAETFENSANTILANNAMIQKHMSALLIRPQKRKQETRSNYDQVRQRGWVTPNLTQDADTEKGKGKGKNSRGKEGGKRNDTALCKNFKRGICTLGDQCRVAHKCSECNRNIHGAFECRSKGSPKNNKGSKGGGKGTKGPRKGPKEMGYDSTAFTVSQ